MKILSGASTATTPHQSKFLCDDATNFDALIHSALNRASSMPFDGSLGMPGSDANAASAGGDPLRPCSLPQLRKVRTDTAGSGGGAAWIPATPQAACRMISFSQEPHCCGKQQHVKKKTPGGTLVWRAPCQNSVGACGTWTGGGVNLGMVPQPW